MAAVGRGRVCARRARRQAGAPVDHRRVVPRVPRDGRTTYADPAVAALVRDRFVPIRVDTDRRPDINERYNLGGWPTTAFLNAAGEVLTGGTFIPVDRMSDVLTRVASAASTLRAHGRGPAEGDDTAGPSLAEAVAPGGSEGGRQSAASNTTGEREVDSDSLITSVFSTYDDQHGGFGLEPKFPHTAPLTLAMALLRETGDAALARDRRAYARRDV